MRYFADAGARTLLRDSLRQNCRPTINRVPVWLQRLWRWL